MEVLIGIIVVGVAFYLGTIFNKKEDEEVLEKYAKVINEAIFEHLNSNNLLFKEFDVHGLSFNTVNAFDYSREDLVIVPIMDLAWMHYKASQYEMGDDDTKWFVEQSKNKLKNLVELMKDEEIKRLDKFHEKNIWSKEMKCFRPKQYPHETDVYDR